MLGLAALALIVASMALGIAGASFWVILILGAIGAVIYVGLRPMMIIMLRGERAFSTAAIAYVTQCFTTGLFFTIGRIIGAMIA